MLERERSQTDVDRTSAYNDGDRDAVMASGLEMADDEALMVARDTLHAFSHRLRSLLTCVGAAAEYMLHNDDGPEINGEMLQIVAEQANRIHALLDDFLVVVGERGTAADQQVDLDALSRQVVRALAAEAQAAGAWLVLDTAAPVPVVAGDQQALRQALIGAVRSVVAVCRRGERVVIALECADGDAGTAPLVLTVSLHTNGVGCARRAQALSRRNLTLDAVRRIIESHGGDLEILAERPGVRWSLPTSAAPVWPAAALSR